MKMQRRCAFLSAVCLSSCVLWCWTWAAKGFEFTHQCSCCGWSMFNKETDFHGQTQCRIIFVMGPRACPPSYLVTHLPSSIKHTKSICFGMMEVDKVDVSGKYEFVLLTWLKLFVYWVRRAKYGLVPLTFCSWRAVISGTLHLGPSVHSALLIVMINLKICVYIVWYAFSFPQNYTIVSDFIFTLY